MCSLLKFHYLNNMVHSPTITLARKNNYLGSATLPLQNVGMKKYGSNIVLPHCPHSIFSITDQMHRAAKEFLLPAP